MRLSNFLIVASTAIVFSAAVIFFVFQTFFDGGGSETDAQDRIAQLEAENQSLLDEAAKSTLTLKDEIKSLKTSLRHSEKLLTENDDEIASLRNQSGSDRLAKQLAAILNCEPASVVDETARLVQTFGTIKLQFEIAKQQLASLNMQIANSQNVNSNAEQTSNQDGDRGAFSRAEPRIKKFGLAGPENVNLGGRDSTVQNSDLGRDSESKKDRLGLIEANALAKQVESLKIELKNREKLLFEQTSLIEKLKKAQRVETGLRTESQSVTSNPRGPFRDRGTFEVQFSDKNSPE